MPVINAIIWFFVRDEAKIPMEENDIPSNRVPRYPPITGPQSRSPRYEIKIL